VLEVATPADLQKLQADLDEANGKVESLTAGNASCRLTSTRLRNKSTS
jgi:hypothetical protein